MKFKYAIYKFKEQIVDSVAQQKNQQKFFPIHNYMCAWDSFLRLLKTNTFAVANTVKYIEIIPIIVLCANIKYISSI